MQHQVGETAWSEAYASLNAAQQQAVDTIEGPVMVIAGPGTGKTQVLTLRIANILRQTDVSPENILALTFTEAGARAMRVRLRSLIGEAAYHIRIQTFHGFADTLIKQYPDAYPTIIGGQAASDLEKIEIIETLLTDTQYKVLRPGGAPAYYLFKILGGIADLKKEYVRPDDFARYVQERADRLLTIPRYHERGAHRGKERADYRSEVLSVTKNQELVVLYRQYEAALRERARYDYEDMILETVRALESNESLRLDVQEQFQYVLADEHQDVNASQNRILSLLTDFHDHPNLFVVGDEKQAIYRFQGASLDNFLHFESMVGSMTTISLVDNYRSGQQILDAAQDLVATNDPLLASLRVPLSARTVLPGEDRVELRTFEHAAVEDRWVVECIKDVIATGVPKREIAIILRSNHEVETYAALLRKAGISVAPTADSDILTHPLTEAIYGLLVAIDEPNNIAALTRLLHAPYLGISLADLCATLSAVSRQQPLFALLSDTARLTEAGVVDVTSLQNVASLLASARDQTVTEAPHRVLETILATSGLLAHTLRHDPLSGTRVIRRIYDEVEAMVKRDEARTLHDVCAQFARLRTHGVALTAPFIETDTDAVVITTAHKSKGLEFEAVYIPHLTDRVWGSKGARKPIFDLPLSQQSSITDEVVCDDERRLLYVALTRAKRQLYLSYALTDSEGKGYVPSRFLGDISPAHLSTCETDDFTKSFSVLTDIVPVPTVRPDTHLIRRVLSERGFSPTSFNNYRHSPWEYLYRNVLRVPQAQSLELQFGTAVHSVLQALHTSLREGVEPNATMVHALLKRFLERAALSDQEYTRLHERGFAALLAYLPYFTRSAKSDSRTEVSLSATLKTGLSDLPELLITGNLDRIDYEGGEVRWVVDYKTGKPKTRGQIAGTTKDSQGDYKYQLTFYALLLSLQSDVQYHSRTGLMSFVEPDKKGSITEEVFEITPAELAALQDELVQAATDLLTGDVFAVACDTEQCHYCDLVAMWQQ